MINSIKKITPRFVKTLLKKVHVSFRNFFLRGDNVVCTVCNKTFITFFPFGVPPSPLRPNAKCPNCNSLERTRIYWQYLKDQEGFFETPKAVLHTAPESQLFKLFRSNPNIDYYPVDKFTKGYKYPKGTINMDITSIDFPDNTFDFILSSHVLEHIPNDRLAMSELHRVLKPGGWGILQVPIEMDRAKTYEDATITSPEERLKAFGQSDHVRIYGKDYIDRLSTAGFEVILEDSSIKLSRKERFRYGFGNGENLFIVKKN